MKKSRYTEEQIAFALRAGVRAAPAPVRASAAEQRVVVRSPESLQQRRVDGRCVAWRK